MNTYTAKTLLTGYQIGFKSPSLFVAVPVKYIKNSIKVVFGGREKMFKSVQSYAERVFNDRFRPGETYALKYFLWDRVSRKEIDG